MATLAPAAVDMITARPVSRSRGIAKLEERAARLAKAYAEEKLRSRRADPLRWRMPRLLWPDMTGEK